MSFVNSTHLPAKSAISVAFFPFLFLVDVSNVRGDIVAVQKSLAAYATFVVPFALWKKKTFELESDISTMF